MSNMNDFVIKNGVLKKYVGPGGNVVVPEGVTKIGESSCYGDHAFSNCESLQSITLPKSIIKIEESAFFNCKNLQSITLPKDVISIGSHAFSNCSSLRSITLPESVTKIERAAFSDCSSLRSITLSENLKTIDDYTFRGCMSLQSITLPESVTKIGEFAFAGCSSLMSVALSNHLTSIGKNAFFGCNSFQCIVLPEKVTKIGDSAFDGCVNLIRIISRIKLNRVQLSHVPSLILSIAGKKNKYLVFASKTNKDNLSDFAKKGSWKQYDLELINNGPVYRYNMQTRLLGALGRLLDPVELTDKNHTLLVELLNKNAKKLVPMAEQLRCTDFISDLLSMRILDEKADKAVRNLLEVSAIPEIANLAREQFSQLDNSEIAEVKTSKRTGSTSKKYFLIENGCLQKYMGSSGDVVVPEGVTMIGSHAFEHCSLTSVVIPEGVTEIGSSAFFDCKYLVDVQLPKTLNVIGTDAFHGCRLITEISLPESMEQIKRGAFTGCGLKTVMVPECLQNRPEDFEIENGKLKRFCGLGGHVIVPDTVKCIDTWAFRDCTTVTGVTLPNGLEKIDEEAFFNTSIQGNSILLPDTLIELKNPGFTTNALLRMTLDNAAALSGRSFRKINILLTLRTGQQLVLCGNSYVKYNLEGFGETGFDWQKYDINIINNGPEFKMTTPYRYRAMLYRMLDPEGMTNDVRECYIALLTKDAKKIIPIAEEDNEPEFVNLLIDIGAINNKNRKAVIKLLTASENPEIAAIAEKI